MVFSQGMAQVPRVIIHLFDYLSADSGGWYFQIYLPSFVDESEVTEQYCRCSNKISVPSSRCHGWCALTMENSCCTLNFACVPCVIVLKSCQRLLNICLTKGGLRIRSP